MSARSIAALALAALALAGCGYTEVHEIALHEPLPPTSDVDVYMSGQALPRPFYEVALLQAIGHGSDADMESVVKGLSTRARELGCDALASVTVDQGFGGAHAFGVCVKYVPGATWPAPPAPRPAAPPPPAPPP